MTTIDFPSIAPYPEGIDSCTADRLVMEQKRDGTFVQFSAEGFWGRRRSALDGNHIPYRHLTQYFNVAWIPQDTLLIGELVVVADGKDCFTLAQRAVSSPKLRWLEPAIVVHDAAFAYGEDIRPLPMRKRRHILEEIMLTCQEKNISLAEQFPSSEQLYRSWVEHGIEGAVYKDPLAPFGQGLWKRKAVQLFNVLAYAAEQGQGRLAHTAGAFRLAAWVNGHLVDVGKVGSGLSDKERDLVSRMLPVRIRVRALGITDSKKLRHPVFQAILPDSEPIDAI